MGRINLGSNLQSPVWYVSYCMYQVWVWPKVNTTTNQQNWINTIQALANFWISNLWFPFLFYFTEVWAKPRFGLQ